MIIDKLENAVKYLPLHKHFQKAFEYLNQQDLKNIPCGKYEIDGDQLFAIISKENGRKKEEAFLEIHRKYIDIQMVIDGIDEMGWSPIQLCKSVKTYYDADSDIQFYFDEPHVYFPVIQNMFAIFFPQDAHKPAISGQIIHKVVIKIAI